MKKNLAHKLIKIGKKAETKAKDAKQASIKGGVIAGLGLAVALACFTVSNVFDSPSEIVSPEVLSPTPVTETLSMDAAMDAGKHVVVQTAPAVPKSTRRAKKASAQSSKRSFRRFPTRCA